MALEPSATESWDDMAKRQAPPWDKLSLKQKFDVVQGLLHFPALTVMVFSRRKLGYRLLNPIYLVVTGFLLVFLQNAQMPYLPTAQATIWPYPLTIFVVAMLVWAFIQRRLRWRDMVRGVHWHTYSRGISYFSFLPLKPDIIARFVDPTIVMLAGVLSWYLISTALGLWLMIGALAFLASEMRFYDLVLGHTLDMLDGLEESRVQSELLMTGPQGGSTPRTIEDAAGIPTGIGDDLVRAVQKRKAEADASVGTSPQVLGPSASNLA